MHKSSGTWGQPISYVPPGTSFIYPEIVVNKGCAVTLCFIISAVLPDGVQIVEILIGKGSLHVIHPFVHIAGHIVQAKIVGRKFIYVGRNDLSIIGSTT